MPLEIYRNRMVAVSLVVTFLTGFGMFGGIIFIPLFFQGVLGASATSSGSFLTPMMLGIVVGATTSGQLLARTGLRYRVFGLVGTAAMTLGLLLVSTMDETTSFARAVVYIVIMGMGLGSTFPTFMLAVQNSIPFNLMGTATSALQFFRSIGGMLGLALLGAVMANRFATKFDESLPDSVRGVLPAEQDRGDQGEPAGPRGPCRAGRAAVEIRGCRRSAGGRPVPERAQGFALGGHRRRVYGQRGARRRRPDRHRVPQTPHRRAAQRVSAGRTGGKGSRRASSRTPGRTRECAAPSARAW